MISMNINKNKAPLHKQVKAEFLDYKTTETTN